MNDHISSNGHNKLRPKPAADKNQQAQPIQLAAPVAINPNAPVGVSQDDLPMEVFEPDLLPVCQPLQDKLQELATAPISGSKLDFALDAIAQDFQRSPAQIEKLYAPLRQQVLEAGDEVSLVETLEARASATAVDVLELVPPALAAGFQTMRSTMEYDPEILLAVLLAGLSGALPLDSEIELNAMEQFRQPLTLWLALLMPSGELKSPLIKRLIGAPWERTVQLMVEEAYRRELAEWQGRQADAKSNQEVFTDKEPVLPLTRVIGDMTSAGMDENFAAHDRWANRSVLKEVDEGATLLKDLMKGGAMANWMLSRYDGTGSVNALVEAGRQRRYKRCRLAAVICCQPDRYYAITGDGDVSGVNARLLVAEQHQVRQLHKESYTLEDLQASQAFIQLLEKIYGAAAACERLHLTQSPEAFSCFQRVRTTIDARKNVSLLDVDRSLLSKSAGLIGRLAGLFHLLWQFVESAEGVELEEEQEVGLEAMERAIRFHDLLLGKTMQVRQKAHEQGTLPALGLRLHGKTWTRAGHSASLSELRRTLAGKGRPNADHVIAALKPLTTKGYGRLHKSGNGQPGWVYTALRPLPGER